MVALLAHSSSLANSWVFSQTKRSRGWVLPHHHHHHHHHVITNSQRDSLPYPSAQTPPPTPQSPSNRISPAILFIIVILAVVFFVSGLLHLLVRFFAKKTPPGSTSPRSNSRQQPADAAGSDALQRQLQQLFHLHDSGLDQAFIDSLPVFLYKEIVGPKEPFDCAVCLCEFALEDKLRLLPVCGHAFHLGCIDTWLLSNSTCPLCRQPLFVQGLAIENPIFEFDDTIEEDGFAEDREGETGNEKRVFPVRLGKFKNLGGREGGGVENDNRGAVISAGEEVGEASSSNLDARRCYSMGSYRYVLGDVNLRVSLRSSHKRNGVGRSFADNEVLEGKRICAGSKGESFSVSKIWQWPNKKGKFPISYSDAGSADVSMPWMERSVGDT